MFARLLSLIESLSTPFQPYDGAPPPTQLGAFFRHFIRQVWPPLAMLAGVGLFVALIEVSIYRYVGTLVDLLGRSTPATLFAEHGFSLLWMLAVLALFRSLFFALHAVLRFQGIEPALTNIVRWQSHLYVLRQSLAFFHNDFAGRIANKVLQTGQSLRAAVVDFLDAIWFVTIYVGATLFLFADVDAWLRVPLAAWIAAYVSLLLRYVPRIRRGSMVMSEARSMLTGRIVDSYTNIQTVKLFASGSLEEDYARDAVAHHTEKYRDFLRPLSTMVCLMQLINGLLIGATGLVAVLSWHQGAMSVGAIAVALGLVIRLVTMSGWIMWTVTNIFENIGTVEEGLETIARPLGLTDVPAATGLVVQQGAITFERVRFHYGKEGGVISDLTLNVAPGEKIGLVGRSGAGKSTLVSLLLRFYDLEGGRILIDGQDICKVTQESLRRQIGVVTQDTSLLHRSVRDNIAYGRPDAEDRDIIRAAERAHAMGFIPDLADLKGRRGLDAHVGERGVKLSGGQRQRIAIARVLLKDAPILVLDEATSALDSEVEAVIQENLFQLMHGKTVIAIAHRLSTIAAMDRLVVMDQGAIIETGRHDDLIAQGGLYAQLWNRQSGGFLDVAAAE